MVLSETLGLWLSSIVREGIAILGPLTPRWYYMALQIFRVHLGCFLGVPMPWAICACGHGVLVQCTLTLRNQHGCERKS